MNLYKRNSGDVWWCMFTVHGKKVNKSTKCTDKKEAKKIAENWRNEIHQDYVAQASGVKEIKPVMLSEAIKDVYKNRWCKTKDAKNVLGRASVLLQVVGDVDIRKVDDETVRKWKVLLADGYETRKFNGTEVSRVVKRSDATVNRYMAMLSVIFNFYKIKTVCIPMNKESKGRICVISLEQEKNILNYFVSKGDEGSKEMLDLITILFDTGARLSEILDSRKNEINLESKLIHIWDTKNSKPRTIPMTERVFEIYSRRKGFTIVKHVAVNRFRNMTKKLKIQDPDWCMHAIRHTACSRLVQAGVSLYVVKELAGHSTIAVTERYSHLAPKNLDAAIEVFNQLHK